MTGNLNNARYNHTATRLLDGSVVVTGGFGLNDLQSTEVYTLATGQWQMNGALNMPVQRHAAALLQDGEIVVAGGEFAKGPRFRVVAVSQVGPP